MNMTVVGILPDHEAVSKLADALESNGFPFHNLTVIADEDRASDLARTGERFVVREREDSRDQMFGKIHLVVPDLEIKQPGEYYSSPALEALSEFSVPDGYTDTYADAIEAGRCVAGFNAGDMASKIKTLFSAAGADHVEVF